MKENVKLEKHLKGKWSGIKRDRKHSLKAVKKLKNKKEKIQNDDAKLKKKRQKVKKKE